MCNAKYFISEIQYYFQMGQESRLISLQLEKVGESIQGDPEKRNRCRSKVTCMQIYAFYIRVTPDNSGPKRPPGRPPKTKAISTTSEESNPGLRIRLCVYFLTDKKYNIMLALAAATGRHSTALVSPAREHRKRGANCLCNLCLLILFKPLSQICFSFSKEF